MVRALSWRAHCTLGAAISALKTTLGQSRSRLRSGCRSFEFEAQVPFAMLAVQEEAMSANTRYWTLHWLRVVLWPLPVLTLVRAGRGALHRVRRR